MLYDTLKKTLATGLGLAAVTTEKAEGIIQDMVKDGNLTKEQGKEILNEWINKIENEREEIHSRVEKEVKRVMDNYGVVSKEEYESLEQRVAQLEMKLSNENSKENSNENKDC